MTAGEGTRKDPLFLERLKVAEVSDRLRAEGEERPMLIRNTTTGEAAYVWVPGAGEYAARHRGPCRCYPSVPELEPTGNYGGLFYVHCPGCLLRGVARWRGSTAPLDELYMRGKTDRPEPPRIIQRDKRIAVPTPEVPEELRQKKKPKPPAPKRSRRSKGGLWLPDR